MPLGAQENIPIGTWRTHLSFNSIQFLTEGDNEIFAASSNGIMRYNFAEQTFTTYSTLNALSGTGISALAYDKQRKQLIVGYSNGSIDLITEGSAINFTRLINPPDVGVSGTINHIFIENSLAYLSTLYGVVVYDLTRNEVKETWRNLGSTGQLLAVHQSTRLADSIYLATAQGVLAGRLTDNLLDFNQWNRFNTGDLNTSLKLISVHNEKVTTAIDAKGIYYFDGNEWLKRATFPELTKYQFLRGENALLLYGGAQHVYSVNNLGVAEEIVDLLILNPSDGVVLDNTYWLGDASTGLLSKQQGEWKTYIPNGPASSFIFKTAYVNNSLVAVHGGFTSQFVAANTLKRISNFTKGLWTRRDSQLDYLTDCEEGTGGSVYLASFGEGLEKMNADGSVVIFNPLNSPLRYLTALTNSASGLWIANYGSVQSLNLLTSTNELLSFNSPSLASRYPFEIAVDASENVWMLIAPAGGGGVSIIRKDGSFLRQLSDQPNGGLLPDEEVLSIAVDKDDYVWIGTAKGVAYYTYAAEDGIRPLVEGRFLLSEERVTTLAIDEGNRKWMGTKRGLWLFNSTGDEAIYNFTTENSPLPSNVIQHVEIDKNTGEVFITTDKGLISFRADATQGIVETKSVKIFPNPVAPEFSGLVGISNLYANAIVKITDMSGKLIRQLQANGGTASWNVTDQNGKRVSTGVYLVIASAEDGSESVAGKVVVID